MTRGVPTYEVNIAYCNDQTFHHQHDRALPAAQEWGELVTNDQGHLRHVREATLVVYDRSGPQILKIESAVLPCVHRGADE